MESLKSKVEGQIVFILMKSGVTGPEIDECLLWAFGPDSLYVPIFPDWIDRWNKLHPDKFHATAKDNFVEFVFVVGTLYVFHKNNIKK
jgi:hypothetical protein